MALGAFANKEGETRHSRYQVQTVGTLPPIAITFLYPRGFPEIAKNAFPRENERRVTNLKQVHAGFRFTAAV